MTLSAEARALYEGMRTEELLRSQMAFEADYRDAHSDKDFCRGRLALIAEVLAARVMWLDVDA
jgi:hypothetical protein